MTQSRCEGTRKVAQLTQLVVQKNSAGAPEDLNRYGVNSCIAQMTQDVATNTGIVMKSDSSRCNKET